MADLSENMVTWDRDETIRMFKRSYKIAQPDADLGPGGQPDIDARVAADMLLPLHADVERIGDTSSLRSRNTEQLDEVGDVEGVKRPPATGASGYVLADTAAGGATIFAGDILRYPATRARYEVVETALYANGDKILVIGLDVGPDSDLPAGTELEWENPRSGCNSTAAVWSEGLTGGREAASDEEYVALIIERRKNPVAAGNDAAVQALVEDATAHGVAVAKAFTYPACKGSGTCGVAFLLRPSKPGASRIPSTAQIEIVGAAVEASFPADDGYFMLTIIEESASVSFKASWRKNAAGWVDPTPWPEYLSSPVVVSNAVSISSSALRLATNGTTGAPTPGQAIGLFDKATARWRKKQFLTVTEVTPDQVWDVTFDFAAGASEVYTPAAGALASPWSDSLNLVAPVLVEQWFDLMGPGELVPSFLDPGRRQRRQPENPEAWPSELGNRLDALLQGVSAVRSGTLVVPSSTLGTTVGVNGVSVYLRRLTDIAIYAED